MTKLFTPLTVGSTTLGHRLVMAPLTRMRNDDDHTPTAIVKGRSTSYHKPTYSVIL